MPNTQRITRTVRRLNNDIERGLTMSSEYQPFAWLNTDKLLSDEVQYFIDLGLLDYYPAISVPLEKAVQVLLNDTREITSALPRISKEDLNDSVQVSKIIRFITELESTMSVAGPKYIAEAKSRALESLKVALNNQSHPQYNILPECGFDIDAADLLALQILQKFEEFYELHCTGSESYIDKCTKLLDFGWLYYFSGVLDSALKEGTMRVNFESMRAVQGTINRFHAGQATKDKALKEFEIIKSIGLEELQKDCYNNIKFMKIPKIRKHEYSKAEFIPWNSINFAMEVTIPNVNLILKYHPIKVGKNEDAKPRNSVSENYYASIIKSISVDRPDLFM